MSEYSVSPGVYSEEGAELRQAELTVQYNGTRSVHVTVLQTSTVIVLIQRLVHGVSCQLAVCTLHRLSITYSTISYESPRRTTSSTSYV